jgi:hypothetical protein
MTTLLAPLPLLSILNFRVLYVLRLSLPLVDHNLASCLNRPYAGSIFGGLNTLALVCVRARVCACVRARILPYGAAAEGGG